MARPDPTPQHPQLRTADLALTRDLDLPPGVVWPALVDPELLEGWLGETEIADDLTFVLRVPHGSEITGLIAGLVEAELLHLETDRGRVLVSLEQRSGGLRGTWTRLSVAAPASVAPVERWNDALDRLEELLHGRPTDWLAATADAARREAR